MNFSKTVPFFFILLFFYHCKKDNSSVNPLLTPKNWRSEIINFPLEFAPSLKYSGKEYVRFAPDWDVKDAENYFSYVFLWEIDQDPKLTSKKLEDEMELYFDGLIHMINKTNPEFPENISKSKAFFEELNDGSYLGKVLTYDVFTTKEEVHLNIMVNTTFCAPENKHLVLFNISPQAPKHPIWKKMKKITIDIKCQ